jgi:hypothetical protein
MMADRRWPVRAKGQPPEVLARLNDEHWFGRLYMRKLSPLRHHGCSPGSAGPRTRSPCFMISGVAAGVLAFVPGLAAAVGRGRADPALPAVRLLRRGAGPAHRPVLGDRHLPGRMGHYLAEALLLAWPRPPGAGAFLADSGGYVSAGLAAAICATLIKAETDNVVVARAKSGLDGRTRRGARAEAPGPGPGTAAGRRAAGAPDHPGGRALRAHPGSRRSPTRRPAA